MLEQNQPVKYFLSQINKQQSNPCQSPDTPSIHSSVNIRLVDDDNPHIHSSMHCEEEDHDWGFTVVANISTEDRRA